MSCCCNGGAAYGPGAMMPRSKAKAAEAVEKSKTTKTVKKTRLAMALKRLRGK
jgi:hypothetical protein